MNDKITVVVPIYNVEKYLSKCIESIIGQTYQNLEIILVDDGSKDNCYNICKEYEKKDNRIKVVHKDNGGLSDARNVGIEYATGKYIAFVDSDDYIESDMYEFLYNKLRHNACDISISGRFIDYDDGRSVNQNKNIKEIIMDKRQALINLNSYVGFDMSACDKLYKIELFKKIRFPKGKKCEDYYTMYKIFDNSNKVIFNSTPKYHYFQRFNSISRNKVIDNAYIDASKSQLEYFKKYHKDLFYIAATSYIFANISLCNKLIKYNIKGNKELKLKCKREVNKYIKYLKKNKYIPFFKKVQALVFSKSIFLYSIIIKIKK